MPRKGQYQPVESRFWSRTDTSGGPDACWIWTANKNKDGYGEMCVHGRLMRANRISYEIANGPITDGRQVLHTCDNPSCVNPAHLYLGTISDNMRDRRDRGRENHVYGEKHHKAKLTEADVREIRRLYATGDYFQYEIADMFGVWQSTIGHIIRGDNWKSVK